MTTCNPHLAQPLLPFGDDFQEICTAEGAADVTRVTILDRKKKPQCRINVTIKSYAGIKPLTYGKYRHRGVAYYDKQRFRQPLQPIIHGPEFEGYQSPPSWIEPPTGCKWCPITGQWQPTWSESGEQQLRAVG